MLQQTLSHPFWAEQVEPAAVIFWRVILRCGVLAGVVCSFLLWGASQATAFVATVLLGSVWTALVTRLFRPGWRLTWSVLTALRASASVTAAVAVITVAGSAGLLLVGLCLALTPSVRSGSRDALRWLVERLRAPHPQTPDSPLSGPGQASRW